MIERSRTHTSGGRRSRRSSKRRPKGEGSDSSPQRRSLQMPPRRALIGGALVALATMGVFAAHRSASSPPETRFLVAAKEIAAGTIIARGDLGSIALDLPNDMDAIKAEQADELIGRVAATSLSKLELVSSNDIYTDGRFTGSNAVEVALDLPAARALAGLISAGSLVDVLSTDINQGGTAVLAAGVRVSSVNDTRSATIGSNGAVRLVLSVDGTDAARALVDASLRAELTLVLPRPVPGGDR